MEHNNVIPLFPKDTPEEPDDHLHPIHEWNRRLFTEAVEILGETDVVELMELTEDLEPASRENIFHTAYDLASAGHDFASMKRVLTWQDGRYRNNQYKEP